MISRKEGDGKHISKMNYYARWANSHQLSMFSRNWGSPVQISVDIATDFKFQRDRFQLSLMLIQDKLSGTVNHPVDLEILAN